MQFFLFRHGETNWNVEGRVEGQLDKIQTSFTEKGYRQLKKVADRLKSFDIQAIFSSDLYRAVEATRVVNEYLQKPVYFFKSFRALNMGEHQGLLSADLLAKEDIQRAFRDYDHVIKGGESINQLLERFCDGLKNIEERYSYDRVLVISHGAAISNVFSYINRTPFESIDYCELTTEDDGFLAVESGKYDEMEGL